MGLLSLLGAGKAGGEALSSPVKAVGTVLDELFTSDDERLTHQEALTRLAQVPHVAQTEISKIEAQHRSKFVAGWRPSIGWVCGIALFFYFVPQYAVASFVWAKLCFQLMGSVGVSELAKNGLPAYPVDAKGLLELVLALLGMGGMRVVEKISGRAK